MRLNLLLDVILKCGNRSKMGMDTVTLDEELEKF